jgi:hypothetical protein
MAAFKDIFTTEATEITEVEFNGATFALCSWCSPAKRMVEIDGPGA